MKLGKKLVFAGIVAGSSLVLAACSDSEAQDGASASVNAGAPVTLDVYKSPTCGCCESWIEHADKHGFESAIHHPQNLNGVKDDLGIAPRFRSCHTAVTEDGYAFEGHVPAKLVQRFLDNPPEGALGLAVPGMPAGSPGMEMGDRFDPYPVVLLYKDGRFELYEEINEQEMQY
ncbi:DUF411 domain-containing protein [Marinobacterium mangrovicola]|uniref:Metal-binding protein n=1 Tax=Marinobacterium mangrovicola TaxID=1476959 RepID=A0A4R1GKS7_9GAMM|nr:DUF411 domain-containing protein [Marinobacterium mangrovicola]TCK08718.1 hypothetical protein CLV83_0810 [Marinobacterium mangrovicola]